MNPHESIHKYVERFYDLKLKAIVYKPIEFEEQKEQFCAGLPKEMSKYINSLRTRNLFPSPSLHYGSIKA